MANQILLLLDSPVTVETTDVVSGAITNVSKSATVVVMTDNETEFLAGLESALARQIQLQLFTLQPGQSRTFNRSDTFTVVPSMDGVAVLSYLKKRESNTTPTVTAYEKPKPPVPVEDQPADETDATGTEPQPETGENTGEQPQPEIEKGTGEQPVENQDQGTEQNG